MKPIIAREIGRDGGGKKDSSVLQVSIEKLPTYVPKYYSAIFLWRGKCMGICYLAGQMHSSIWLLSVSIYSIHFTIYNGRVNVINLCVTVARCFHRYSGYGIEILV